MNKKSLSELIAQPTHLVVPVRDELTFPICLGTDEVSTDELFFFTDEVIEQAHESAVPTAPAVPPLSISEALEQLNKHARDCKLSPNYFRTVRKYLDFLQPLSNLTEIQWVMVAVIANWDEAMPLKKIGDYLGLGQLRMYKHASELEDLVKEKMWCITTRRRGKTMYQLKPAVLAALSRNEVYVPEPMTGLTTVQFVQSIVRYMEQYRDKEDYDGSIDEAYMRYLIRQNPDLPICRAAQDLDPDIHSDTLLCAFVFDYALFGDVKGAGLSLSEIRTLLPAECRYEVIQDLCDGCHELIDLGYVEPKCVDGMADPQTYVLTKKMRDEVLEGWKPFGCKLKNGRAHVEGLIRWQNLTEKELYYNSDVQQTVGKLFDILSGDNLSGIQGRMSELGMRTGVAVLLEGGPGTGKTELVKQLARKTQRDLMMVDLSGVKSKYVGESEENVAAIFSRYKSACKAMDRCPILFVNECDGLLGKRNSSPEHAVDKMENAIQNLLLQALEDLEGVIICTTNLAPSLDTAFERRFLMRVRIDKPDAVVRGRILQSMLPTLPQEDITYLSERYELSGGQMENVTRKVLIDQVLSGSGVTREGVEPYCKEEVRSLKGGAAVKKIGF